MALHFLSLLVIASTTSLAAALPTALRPARDANPVCTILGSYTDVDTIFHEMDVTKATCEEWRAVDGSSGVYKISPTGICEFEVFCDTCLSEGEGWIVVQRRESNTVAFHHKQWEEYKNGFGDYRYNYWMGLERLHAITSSGNYELFVGFYDPNVNAGGYMYATYKNFSVADENQKYRLTITGFESSRSTSTVADSLMNQHNGKRFSTPGNGNDNDDNPNKNCAQHDGYTYGGWWFGGNDCIDVNLNGEYYSIFENPGPNSIVWQGGGTIPLTNTIMAIKKA